MQFDAYMYDSQLCSILDRLDCVNADRVREGMEEISKDELFKRIRDRLSVFMEREYKDILDDLELRRPVKRRKVLRKRLKK